MHMEVSIRFPIVVGVTGHRDLRPADIGRLSSGVSQFFRGLQARYPHTPLVLLSPLAEGADRLAAEVAVKMGVRLIVPLPMPRQLYEMDFLPPRALPRPEEAESAAAEFRRLLEAAEEWFELPLLPGVSA